MDRRCVAREIGEGGGIWACLNVSCTRYARSSEGSAAVARGVERSETTRATAGDGPNGGILLDRADSPGATKCILRRERQGRTVPRRKGRNRCPVGRPRLRAPVQGPDGVAVMAPVFACTISGRLHGADRREVH